jgi:hypothetical protein
MEAEELYGGCLYQEVYLKIRSILKPGCLLNINVETLGKVKELSNYFAVIVKI